MDKDEYDYTTEYYFNPHGISEDNPLDKELLEGVEQDNVFLAGRGYIEHPWFNQATPAENGGTLHEDGRSALVNFVVFRGFAPDWKVYNSMTARFTGADHFDDPEHLDASLPDIRDHGASLYKSERSEDYIRNLVPCTDKVFKLYRN